MNYYQGDPQPKRLDFSESKPIKTFIEQQQEEARKHTSGVENDTEGNLTYLITSESLNSLISQVVQNTVNHLNPLIERVRLDVDVIKCDCGEPYKDSDLDLSVGELEQEVQSLLKDITSNTKSE